MANTVLSFLGFLSSVDILLGIPGCPGDGSSWIQDQLQGRWSSSLRPKYALLIRDWKARSTSPHEKPSGGLKKHHDPWDIPAINGGIHGQIPAEMKSLMGKSSAIWRVLHEKIICKLGPWLAASQLNKWCIGAPIPFLPVTNHQHVLRSLHPRHGIFFGGFLVST